jgi:Leucine-rich repeat (LRR) protein
MNITLHKITLDENQQSFEGKKQLAKDLMDQANINLPILRYLNPYKKGAEVKFNADADVATHFPSALKCWRIMKPTVIEVC